MKIRAAIIGSTGYVGAELTRLLHIHPHIEITYLSSTSSEGKYVHQVFPHLKNFLDNIIYQKLDLMKIADSCDIVFLCVDVKQSLIIVPKLMELSKSKLRIIDMSAAYRVPHNKEFRAVYDINEDSKVNLQHAIYGLPELNRKTIISSQLIANPGCMATCALLALLPLLKDSLINSHIFINALTGTSGSGKKEKIESQCSEQKNGLRPYKIHNHRHKLEVEMVADNISEVAPSVYFTTVSTDLVRGVQCIINAHINETLSHKEIVKRFRSFYKEEPFIRLMTNRNTSHHMYPNPKLLIGSNNCDISFDVDESKKVITIISSIDNLMKGAAGQAIQNMNIMFGINEKYGLESVPIYPV